MNGDGRRGERRGTKMKTGYKVVSSKSASDDRFVLAFDTREWAQRVADGLNEKASARLIKKFGAMVVREYEYEV